MFQRKDGHYPHADFRGKVIEEVMTANGYDYIKDMETRSFLRSAIHATLRQSDLYLNRQYNLRDEALEHLSNVEFEDENITKAIQALNLIGESYGE